MKVIIIKKRIDDLIYIKGFSAVRPYKAYWRVK